MKSPHALLPALALALAPALGRAQPAPEAPPAPAPAPTLPPPARAAPPTAAEPRAAPLGLVLAADLGGGGSTFAGADPAQSGLFEGELSVGYEFLPGFRPELGFAVGLAPHGHVALRPGFHYALPDLPFYVRGALDWSTVRGSGNWRWLLGGLGAEVRLTDVLGGFAEADLGVPIASDTGLGFLLRAGVTFRL